MATAKKKLNKALNKNARAWVKALRSGKYKQTHHALTEVNVITGEITGNCCLGVACELAKAAGEPIKTEIVLGKVVYDGENAYLPESVQKWLGLASFDGTFTNRKGSQDLGSENDGGKSFKQIARIIEQKAAELFV